MTTTPGPFGPQAGEQNGESRRSLEIMLIDSENGAADAETRALKAAGHRVHRCHEPGLGSFPCNGLLEDEGCPLDGSIDVAVTLRRHAWPRPSSYEAGVSCALRRGVPVVVAGRTVLNPYERWAAASVDDIDGLERACRSGVRAHETELALAARQAVEGAAAAGGQSAPAVVHVERLPDRVRVMIGLPELLPSSDRTLAANRAAAAVRAHGGMPRKIDVSVYELVGDESAGPLEEV